MHRGLLVAFLAAFWVAMTGAVVAAPLSDISEGLPSSFTPAGNSGKNWRQDLQPLSQPRGLRLPSDRETFPASLAAPHSFVKAALDSSLEPPRDRLAPSIADLVTVASLVRTYLSHTDRTPLTDEIVFPHSERSGATVRDLMKTLVHRTSDSVFEKAKRKNTDGKTFGNFLLTSMLETQLDMAFVNIASGVVNPSIDLAGMITLHIFGVREIVVFMAPITKEIQILDFRTNRFASISRARNEGPTLRLNPNYQDNRRNNQSQETDHKFGATNWVKTAKKIILGALRHPLTIWAVFIVLMLVFVRRMAKYA